MRVQNAIGIWLGTTLIIGAPRWGYRARCVLASNMNVYNTVPGVSLIVLWALEGWVKDVLSTLQKKMPKTFSRCALPGSQRLRAYIRIQRRCDAVPTCLELAG